MQQSTERTYPVRHFAPLAFSEFVGCSGAAPAAAWGAASMAYTFKDDGGTMTYYREYNKEVLEKNETLVGNWVEERALRDQIGTGRYATHLQLWPPTSKRAGQGLGTRD